MGKRTLQRCESILLSLFLLLVALGTVHAAAVGEADGKTYIVDQKGERWDITQAIGLGFRPEGFQFGIGRNAIRPLDDGSLAADGVDLPEETRIIGISDAESGSAHAYSVRRLTRHEIANTHLGETPIAAAY